MLRGQPLDLGDELGATAGVEVGVDPPLLRGEAKLLEPRGLVPPERLVGEIAEGGPTP